VVFESANIKEFDKPLKKDGPGGLTNSNFFHFQSAVVYRISPDIRKRVLKGHLLTNRIFFVH